MDKLKPMPEHEKYQHAFEMVRLYQKHVLPFVEENLGYAAMHNLRSIWQAAIIPIHQSSDDHEKYEQAYSNWLWIARYSHDTLADQLSTEEVLQYKRLLLRLYIQHSRTPYLGINRLAGAFTSLAKAYLYEMQWMTPLEISSQEEDRLSCTIQDCKVLRAAKTERVCRVDCRNVGTAYAGRVYDLKRVTEPANHSCKITLTPLEL